MTDDPQTLIAALGRRNEHAERLAILASAAVQVEPELLRALRLQIPNADAGAEADFWLSDLVESRSALGMTLRPDVRRLLHERLERDRAALETAARVLDRIHRDVTDVIRIEEQVTIESLRGGDGAKGRINALLAPIIATLESERHAGLARWAVRALDALPRLANETESVWRLMRSSSVTRAVGGGTSGATTPLESVLSELPKRKVRLRLRRDALELEAERRPKVMVGGTMFSDPLHRRTVFDILHSLGFDVLAPEYELQLSSDAISDSFRMVDAAEVYILIVGFRYGNVMVDERNPESLSLIEMVYRRALARGITVSPFLQTAKAGSIAFDDSVKLQQLREEIVRTSPSVSFSTIDELRANVLRWATEFRKRLLSSTPGMDIDVPDTVPLMLEVSWDDGERQSRRLALQPGETLRQALRPRNVVVAAVNGEAFAVEPEWELEDYAVVIAAEHDRQARGRVSGSGAAAHAQLFREWLVARDGGRLSSANVRDARTADQLKAAMEWPPGKVRRVYVYFKGAATRGFGDLAILRLQGGQPAYTDTNELREQLEQRVEEIVILVDGELRNISNVPRLFTEEKQLTRPALVLASFSETRDASFTQNVVDGLRGAAVERDGTISAHSLAEYVTRVTAMHGAMVRWTAHGNLVLRVKVQLSEATLILRIPPAMRAAELRLDGQPLSALTSVLSVAQGETTDITLRPGPYKLEIPQHLYRRTLILRPGSNDINLGWRFNGRWVIVAGTANPLLSADEDILCEATARALADRGFGLITGAYKGVDELAADVFIDRVGLLGGGAVEVFRQYVQTGFTPSFKVARTLTVEDDYEAPLSEASALILIGGKRGTEEYARRAQLRQVPVFPIAEAVAAEMAGNQGLPHEVSELTPELARDVAHALIDRIETFL